MIVARVTNSKGRTFNVRLVQHGERYGLKDCLVHKRAGADEALVEFWDATYENDPRFTAGLGQFVARYSYGTLAGRPGHYGDRSIRSSGLDLCGHEPAWKLTGENVSDALDAVEDIIGPEHDDECITRCPDDPRGCRIGHACWCSEPASLRHGGRS